jgi:hypothetical protein
VTSTDARESLKGIAVKAGVKTRPLNLSIRGVRDTFERRCNFKIDGQKFEVHANPSLLFVRVQSESSVVFSTPTPSPILSIGLLLRQVAGRDVFVNADGRWSPAPWIYGAEAVAALSSLDLRGDEHLTVARNGPEALLYSAGAEADWERLQKLLALARILPPAPKEERLDPNNLPEDLRDLFPLLARWGVPDDGERSDLVSEAKAPALQRLVDRVEPRMARIAEFLKEHGEEDSGEVFALDALAQCAMEARQELTKRSRPGGSM